jgi:uncharacterized membrane protein YkoI
MNRAWKARLALIAIAAAASGRCAAADDNIPLDTAPPGVQATVKRVVGTDKLDHLDKDVENGKTVYEVDVNAKSGSFSVHMSDTGEVLGISLDIPMGAVPENVMAAAKHAHPGAKISEPEIRSEKGQLFYKLELMVGKEKHELQIDGAAKIVSDEKDTEGGADDDKKK